MNAQYLLLILSLFFSRLLAAQSDPPAMSLEDCLDKALEQNLTIQISRYEQDILNEQIREVKTSFLPRINLNADHKYYFDLPTQVAPASLLGAPGALPDAGTGEQYIPLAFGVPHQTNLTLQLQQVIYNPQLPVGIKAVTTGKEAANLQLMQTREDVAYQVSTLYFQAQTLAQQISLLNNNINSLDRLIVITQLMQENDLMKRTDVERLKLNQASLINQRANLQDNYEQLINHLKLMTNTPEEEPMTIDTAITVNERPMLVALDSAQRTDLELAKKKLEIQQLEERRIQAGYLPSLSAVAMYGQTGYGKLDEDYYEFFPISYVGLQMNLPLFDGLSKHSQRAQKVIEQKQTKTQIDFLEQNIRYEITNALSSLDTQQKSVRIQKQALQLAESVYDDVVQQFKEGLVGVSEVIDSENELRRTQTEYLSSWISLQQAKLSFQKATGSLLKHR